MTERAKADEGVKAAKREANSVIALGLGVAALGAGGALLSAAVCPVCVVVAPALVGAGAVKRVRIARKLSVSKETER